MSIHLILHPDYSQSAALKSRLKDALESKGLLTDWQEFQAGDIDPENPQEAERINAILKEGKVLLEFGNDTLPEMHQLNEALGCGPACACDTAKSRKFQWKKTGTLAGSILLSLGIALFPKCPMCWAAYMSALGFAGLENLPYQGWMLPVMIALLGLNFYILLKSARKRNFYGPFIIGLSGGLFLLIGRFWLNWEAALYIGVIGIMAGSLWNALPANSFQFVTNWIKPRKISADI